MNEEKKEEKNIIIINEEGETNFNLWFNFIFFSFLKKKEKELC